MKNPPNSLLKIKQKQIEKLIILCTTLEHDI